MKTHLLGPDRSQVSDERELLQILLLELDREVLMPSQQAIANDAQNDAEGLWKVDHRRRRCVLERLMELIGRRCRRSKVVTDAFGGSAVAGNE